MFFDQNGNRDLYKRLKEDEKLQAFHFTIHYFISNHIPKSNTEEDPLKPKMNLDPGKKSLKDIMFDKNIKDF